ncbi:peptidoglycan DD-metalloendopeptidase family protein [Pendulispora brunnea]|uniref:Peptidoglycan DD-metalloendopeptidase family protein n=1 Tax=Pendulispora brunnea TaxID=2905690 RepID=A0ABZ2K6C9_9BACT
MRSIRVNLVFVLALVGCAGVADEETPVAASDELTAAAVDPEPAVRAPDHEWSADSSEEGAHHDSLRLERSSKERAAANRAELAPSCNKADLHFSTWPVSGAHGKQWMINNYTDLDADATDTRDYKGKTGSLARTYDGHRGADIDISSFREMDNGTAIVRAAADGVVEFIREDQFDRNTSCTGTWNVVVLRHANGYASYYGHVKKNSVVVNVGDSVVAGQKLAVVGSSGCSTQAHLHFEVHDCSDAWLESFEDMWTAPPAYEGPSDIMDVMLKEGAFSSAQQIKDPAPNDTLYAPGATMGVGLSAAIRGGDKVQISMVAPDSNVSSWTWTAGGVARYAHWMPSWTWKVGNTPGTWTMRVFVNNALKTSRTFKVSNLVPGFAEVARHGVSAANFQTVFDDVTAAGYRPVWIDGFNIGNDSFFNMLFRPAGNVWWLARAGMTSAQYQSEFTTQSQDGHRLVHVDSYLSAGAVRYNGIWTNESGPAQTAYHGASEALHQSNWNSLTNQGWRPVNVSVVSVGGARQITALWDSAPFGSFVGLHGIPASQYQATFDAEVDAGRRPHYLDTYVHNGQVFYSAIFSSQSLGSWVARHDRTSAQYQSDYDSFTGQGFLTKFVTGVSDGGTANYAAVWTK